MNILREILKQRTRETWVNGTENGCLISITAREFLFLDVTAEKIDWKMFTLPLFLPHRNFPKFIGGKWLN